MKILTAVSLCGLMVLAFSAPVEERPPEIIPKEYLVKYGYLFAEVQDDPIEFSNAVMKLQREAGLPETGLVDEETKELMEMPRCDFGNPNLAEYRVVGRWRKRSLTYNVKDYTNDMTRQQQREEIRRAFQVWSDVSGLTFTETTPRTGDIEIRFARRYHGDGDAFDGPGGTLAHAYFPFAGGNAHFDDDESFTFNSSRGINLFQVVAHELGHSLGLDHSSDRTALMAAFYRGYQRNFRLARDDVQGIQRIYGENTNNPQQPNNPQNPNTPRPTRRPNVPNNPPQPTRRPNVPNFPRPDRPSNEPFCTNSRLDAMFSLSNGRTYGFQGTQYYRFNDNGLDAGYPRLISRYWPGLPDNVDGAISFERGPSGREEIWFFKGNLMYVHGTNGRAIRSSRPISQAIPGLPNDIDAIFKWSGNSRIYAFKGSQYYKISTSNDQVEGGYPRSINVWTQNSAQAVKDTMRNGGIDSVLQYTNGKSYFFKGQDYYRLNDNGLRFDSGYPRRVSRWWFGCVQ